MKSKLIYAFHWLGSPMVTFMTAGVWACVALLRMYDGDFLALLFIGLAVLMYHHGMQQLHRCVQMSVEHNMARAAMHAMEQLGKLFEGEKK